MDLTNSVIPNERGGDILLVSTDIEILEWRGNEKGRETETEIGTGKEKERRNTVCTCTRGHDIAKNVSLTRFQVN